MWPEYPYQTQWEYLCDEHTGRPVRPLRYRKVTYRTGDYFPSRQETDTFARAGLDPVFPNWEMLRGILVAERIPAEQIERLTIPAIVGILGRLYPPQPPASEQPARSDAEPKQDGNGQAEAAEETETPPWHIGDVNRCLEALEAHQGDGFDIWQSAEDMAEQIPQGASAVKYSMFWKGYPDEKGVPRNGIKQRRQEERRQRRDLKSHSELT